MAGRSSSVAGLFVCCVVLLVNFSCAKSPCELKNDELCPEYDFIVVGAGSAGAVVASRLSENENWHVLLLEAGGDETTLSKIPALFAAQQMTSIDWSYKTEPQDDVCLAMKDNQCVWPRGRVLGGSSSINYMVYCRGAKGDYDDWAARGNPGWSYKDVFPYFLKSEGNRDLNDEYHNQNGPLHVENIRYHTPLAEAFVEAGQTLGYPNIDTNGASQVGFQIIQSTTRNGSRCSTNTAFLQPVKGRRNLHISTYSYATKILIDPTTKVAYGVEYVKAGEKKMARVRKEVVVSGGTINSPQLLMLSGVGPKTHLESLGIPVVKDLPGVGQNLRDHVAFGGLQFVVNAPVTLIANRVFSDPNTFLNYLSTGESPLAITGIEAFGFVYTPYADRTKEEADIELFLFSASLAFDEGKNMRRVGGVTQEYFDKVYASLIGKDVMTIFPMLQRPRSSGTIELKSADPLARPVIKPNYFADPFDMKVAVEGIKVAIDVAESEPFKKFGVRLHDVPIPGCESYEFRSDAYWECGLRHYTFNVYHYSGTCKMGPSTDRMAVVDPELRVYGIKGLRVADASIMPQVISGHTNAPSIMIGEKVSDMIKESY